MPRVLASIAVVVTACYILPFDRFGTQAAIAVLVIGLVLPIGLIAFLARAIIQSPFPNMWATDESIATSIPLFLVLFAGIYVALAMQSANNFGRHLTHTDGLYFTVTVFSTVGFGDITAKAR